MISQLLRRLGFAVGSEICRRAANHPFHVHQFSRHRILGRCLGQPQGEVDIVGDEINQFISQHQFARQFRVIGNDFGQ